jgi:hypothetical protein
MKYIVLSLVVFLSACTATVPVKQKFPEAPAELFEKCPTLNTIEPGKTAITDLLKTVVGNYALYYECAIKQEGWTNWYGEQKKIFNKANEK